MAGCIRCSPDFPTTKSADWGFAQVHVDTAAKVLTINRDGKELFSLDVTGVAFRHGDATYEMQYGMFDVRDNAEEWVRAERMELSHDQEVDAILFNLLDGSGNLLATGKVNPVRDGTGDRVALTLANMNPNHNRSRMAFGCEPNDHFNGLGAQSADVDHRGQRVPLWVSEQGIGKTDNDDLPPTLWQLVGRRHTTQVPIPAVVTSRGTAWLLDTYAYAVFDLCKERTDRVSLEAWEGTLRFNLYTGPTPLKALEELTRHMGRPRLPAPWAFAPWNDAVHGTQSVRDFAQFLRTNHIPSSAIWSEDWKGGFQTGAMYTLTENWNRDETLYPNFTQLTSDLRAQGIAMQVYRNPFMFLDADLYAEARDGHHLITDVNGAPYTTAGAKFTDTAFIDFTNAATRTWMVNILAQPLALGALGWMADYAEWMPVDGAHLSSGENPELVHNRYPLMWQQANNDALAQAGKLDEAVLFYRSGHLRSQALAQVMWAGDQRTSFEADDGLPTIVPIGLGLAATGFPFFAHDVAGYQSATNGPVTRELFYRWTELGALTPVMRTHHGTNVSQNWNLRSDADSTAHFKRYAQLHIRLYPYLRALAHAAVDHGQPLWLGLGLLHPSTEAAWGVKDEFMLGPAMLVAPVMTEGAITRDIYFPPGRYAPMLTAGDEVVGPITVSVAAPLEEIPIYLAAGGLVPMTAEPAETLFSDVAGVPGLESTEGDRVVYVGLGAESDFTEESGASYALRGTGTSLAGLAREADGSMRVTGNATLTGMAFTLTLSGHPDARVTHVFFR
jgi:alpha-glucosidase